MKIVSLCPSLTELVFDLGRGDDLVGVTKFCVHPAEGVATVEKVGGTKSPRIDRIIDLAPDLVLLNEEENRIEDLEALRERSVPCHTSFPRSIPETAEMVRSIGRAIRAEDRARWIASEIEERARRARDAARERTPIRYAYLIWRNPIMVVGGDTFVSALLGVAGGVNVFETEADRYPSIDEAQLARARPDAVLLSTEPFPFRASHVEELSEATGIPREQFRIVDGELLSWHGSRTPRGIDYASALMEAIHSELEVKS